MEKRLQEALDFAVLKHAGQLRKGGAAYITHPMAVAAILQEKGYPESYQIAGLFHDLLEDTDATVEEIAAIGGPEVLAAVKLLTKEPGYTMADYIARIEKNPMARAVKGADRLHNLRCAPLADENFRRKYIKESMEWYLGFMPEIQEAVLDLNDTLTDPLELNL